MKIWQRLCKKKVNEWRFDRSDTRFVIFKFCVVMDCRLFR
jgi:hypothetical protein